jgi:hypothetical protein
MDTTVVALSFLAGVTVIALLVVWGIASAARRRERERARLDRIHQWAAHFGWVVTTSVAVDWIARLPSERRQPRGVTLMVSGVVRGRPVAVAEYFYVAESMADSNGTRTTTTTHLIVTAVRLATAYPPIAVQPRRAMSRLGRAMFGAGVTSTGHNAFDRRFRVRTEEPALVRALFGPALLGEHLAGSVPLWDLAGYDLLTWQRGRLDDPRQIPALVASLVRVADLLAG